MTNGRDLLETAVEAHGGLQRWRSVREVKIRVRTGGIALPLRFKPAPFKSCAVRVSTSVPKAAIAPYPRKGHQGIFENDTVAIVGPDGAVVKERRDPRAAFTGFRRKIFWDDLDALYFGAYAFWNYLNLPFLLSGPGFELREMEPWDEDGERWRRLHVVFPDAVPTHCREQVFYFNPKGLLVRHDYTAEVFGRWARAAHYSGVHTENEDLVFPARRRVFPRLRSGRALFLVTLVSIDIDDIEVIAG